MIKILSSIFCFFIINSLIAEELKEEDENYQLSYNFIKGSSSKIMTDFKLQIEKKDFKSTGILQRSQRRRIFQNHHVGQKVETEKLKLSFLVQFGYIIVFNAIGMYNFNRKDILS